MYQILNLMLALLCFVKMFGGIFLGSSRSDATQHAHDPSLFMLVPMTLLALGCVCIGLFPFITLPLLEETVRTWAGLPRTTELCIAVLAPMSWITIMGLSLSGLILCIFLIMKFLPRANHITRNVTWDCGYARPTPRMQYTASSISQMLTTLLAWLLLPQKWRTAITHRFPRASSFKSQTPDVVLDRGLIPAVEKMMNMLPWARRFQHGNIHAYILYVLLIVVFLLLLGA